ncbi:tRNA (adenosine(37)-N6)-threonylcarbamoyltransferase complex ATPase subunit type 1 TsaE [Methylomonas sp. AM2-LC]|uniref:tRNA (adenosine(37)-N6)-threonylcarbamoyltransferase complex ATPase subunit type 1 TsaE n=1 Tax=Methylomonas sp. AM2-LC TaxID=3153301 RepID=UPI0032658913
MQFHLHNAQETENLGSVLWRVLPSKALVFMYGELGTGKTTLMRGLLRAAGYQQVVRSPTYSLVEEYQLGDRSLFHFDLYRLSSPEELEWIGMDDYLQQNALCFIEWPQRGLGFLPVADVEIHLQYHESDSRLAEIIVLEANLKNKIQQGCKNNNILL